MKSHIAEYVSPGHPDRLSDAIVESIVGIVKTDCGCSQETDLSSIADKFVKLF